MVCRHCGADSAQDSKFCKQCGAAFAPDKAKGKSRGFYIMSFIALLLAVALALTYIYGNPFVIYEEPSMATTDSNEKEVSFDSAEAAIEYCVKALNTIYCKSRVYIVINCYFTSAQTIRRGHRS